DGDPPRAKAVASQERKWRPVVAASVSHHGPRPWHLNPDALGRRWAGPPEGGTNPRPLVLAPGRGPHCGQASGRNRSPYRDGMALPAPARNPRGRSTRFSRVRADSVISRSLPSIGRASAGLLTAVGTACALLAWTYWPAWADMVGRWLRDPQYSHGFLVPVFAAF